MNNTPIQIVNYNYFLYDSPISSDEILDRIHSEYNIFKIEYGQIIKTLENIHIKRRVRYFIYNGKHFVESQGYQCLKLEFELTQRITDICAKYPAFSFDNKAEHFMYGIIRPDDKLFLNKYLQPFPYFCGVYIPKHEKGLENVVVTNTKNKNYVTISLIINSDDFEDGESANSIISLLCL